MSKRTSKTSPSSSRSPGANRSSVNSIQTDHSSEEKKILKTLESFKSMKATTLKKQKVLVSTLRHSKEIADMLDICITTKGRDRGYGRTSAGEHIAMGKFDIWVEPCKPGQKDKNTINDHI